MTHNTCCNLNDEAGNSSTRLENKKKEKRKQKKTAGVGRKKGGDQASKRNGH